LNDFVTLSIGICTLIPQAHLFPRDLIGQADQLLYHAKANGRNQVGHKFWKVASMFPEIRHLFPSSIAVYF